MFWRIATIVLALAGACLFLWGALTSLYIVTSERMLTPEVVQRFWHALIAMPIAVALLCGAMDCDVKYEVRELVRYR